MIFYGSFENLKFSKNNFLFQYRIVSIPVGAQARMVRTARDHEARMTTNMKNNHTNMKYEYCGIFDDILPI